MFREILQSAHVQTYATAALVLFCVAFVGLTLVVLTRKKHVVRRWSELPLDDYELPRRTNDSANE
jgi:hypothetical protein